MRYRQYMSIAGALRIVRTEGNLLSLVTATSTEYTFDVDSMVLTPK